MTGLVQGLLVGKMAFGGLSKAIGGDKKAMEALGPAARGMVKNIQGLQKQWQGVTQTVQKNVFAGMAGPIKNIGNTLLPVMKKNLGATGGQVNLLMKDIAKFATSKTFLSQFGSILKGNTAIFGQLRLAAVPVLSGIVTLLKGIMPSALGVSKGVVGVAKGFQSWAQGIVKSGALNRIIQRGLGIFRDLWNIIKNVGGVLGRFFGAAAGPGAGLIKTLSTLSDKLKGVASSADSKGGIAAWAQSGIDALKSVGGFISKIMGGLGSLGAGSGIAKMFDPSTLTTYMTVPDRSSTRSCPSCRS
jgi:hypothetical protein